MVVVVLELDGGQMVIAIDGRNMCAVNRREIAKVHSKVEMSTRQDMLWVVSAVGAGEGTRVLEAVVTPVAAVVTIRTVEEGAVLLLLPASAIQAPW